MAIERIEDEVIFRKSDLTFLAPDSSIMKAMGIAPGDKMIRSVDTAAKTITYRRAPVQPKEQERTDDHD